MKIFYDARGKNGIRFELQDVQDLPKMKKIKGVFAYITLDEKINFNYSLENVIDGSYAFYWNRTLENFNINLNKLENGEYMFYNCVYLTSFSSALPSLTNGDWMFYGCPFTAFSPDLPSLTDGSNMFYNCKNLTSFSSQLPSLTNGDYMFAHCGNLTSFDSNLSGLTNGEQMFRSCRNLKSFSSDLVSLKCGYYMFYGCKINETSLINIADNINDIRDLDKNNNADWTYEVLGETKTISDFYRGRIDIDLDSSVTQEVIIECGNTLIEKGWDVYFNDTLYEYTNIATPYDVSEANGYIPDAYKDDNSWNRVVLIPNMSKLKISIVNEKGEMLNDE